MYYLFVLLLLISVTCAVDPRVTIYQGTLQGKTMTTRFGRQIKAFQGIPFAAAPVGALRFKPPEQAPSWSGVRLAQQEGSDCPQIHFFRNTLVGNEDCLYLNVYTPKLVYGKFSVMVWVHGGGFFSGSGSTEMYGPELLLDHDIVLVTFNYRIGPLGFLSLGTSSAPGNYGLKDQVAALQWVQNNIAKFGGNPASVTIFGESAGGASVHYLMLSPLALGLFHRAIAQSGSAFNGWAITSTEDAADEGTDAALELGCNQGDLDGILECLRQIPPLKLVEVAASRLMRSQKITLYTPTIEPCCHEGAFLNEDPRVILERGEISDVPFMAGLMTLEGMLRLFILKNNSVEKDYEENIINYVAASGLCLEPYTPYWYETWQTIENFYNYISNDDFMEQYLLLSSDIDFVLGVDEMVRGIADLERSPVYYYQFSFEGHLNFIKRIANITRPGTCHADDLPYLFTLNVVPEWKTAPAEDQTFISHFTTLWTNFAITGNPTPNESLGVIWEPVTSQESMSYLDIGSELEMHFEDLNGKRIEFWKSFDKDILRTEPTHVHGEL